MVIPESDDVSDEDFTAVNPSSPSAGPPPSAEQRGRSRRDERSRSRERMPPHSSSHGADEDPATADPQNRLSGRARSTQEQEVSRRLGPQTQKGKKTVAEKQPSELPKTKKHKSMDSDEDDASTSERAWNLFKLSTYCTSTSSSSRISSKFSRTRCSV